ncbi:MAG: VOC family protein [Actinophytocola sp.]|nr:VOC family protein [Actinophytocola sp.]
MRQQLTVLTLGVTDLDESKRFYIDGLGWTPTLDVPGEVVFFQIAGGQLLALFGKRDLEADADGQALSDPGAAPISLGYNVDSEAEVVEALAQAEAAGATIIKPAQRADFGGFHGYFADPSGFRWEVVYNAGFHIADDGTVSIGAVP